MNLHASGKASLHQRARDPPFCPQYGADLLVWGAGDNGMPNDTYGEVPRLDKPKDAVMYAVADSIVFFNG